MSYQTPSFSFDVEEPGLDGATAASPSTAPSASKPSRAMQSTRFGPGANGGGGTFSAEVSGKTHLVLLTETHCRGYIGRSGQARICLLPDAECLTASHQEKLDFEGSRLYVKVPRRDQAFVHPSLAVEKIPAGCTLDELRTSLRPAAAWKAYLLASDFEEDSVESDSTEEEENVFTPRKTRPGADQPSIGRAPAADFARAARKLRTPAKLKKTLPGDPQDYQFQGARDDLGWIPDLNDLNGDQSTEGEDAGDGGTDSLPNRRWHALVSSIETLCSVALRQSEAFNSFTVRVFQAFDTNDDRILSRDKAMQVFAAKIGSPKEEGEFFESALWEAIESISDTLDDQISGITEAEVGEMMGVVTDQLHKEFKFSLGTLREVMDREFQKKDEKVQEAIDSLGKVIDSLGRQAFSRVKKLEELTQKMSSSRPPSAYQGFTKYGSRPEPIFRDPQDGEEKFQDVLRRLADLERTMEAQTRNESKPASGMTSEPPLDKEDVYQKLADHAHQISLLDKKIQDKKVFKSDDGSFSSFGDVLAFVREHNIRTIALYPDCFSLFVLMVSRSVTGMEHANRLVASSKVDREARDSEMLATLSQETIPFFFSATADMSGNKLVPKAKGFGHYMPSYEEYDANLDSLKQRINTWLDEAVAAITDNLDMSDPGHRLSACMTRKARMQAGRVLDFITNFYRTLTTACRYPPGPAWNLTGRATRQYFAPQRTLRAPVSSMEDLRPEANVGRFLWTMMKSLNLAQEIIDQGFQSHPAIMREVMEFQLENRVDLSQLEKINEEVKSIKTMVKDSAAAVQKTEKSFTSLSEKVAKVHQDVGNLKTEVKKATPPKK